MSLPLIKKSILFFIILVIASCDSKPRVIESESTSTPTSNVTANSIPSLNEPNFTVLESGNSSSEEHKVVVGEILNTDKYTYMNVTEGEEKFWLVTSKMEAKEGDTYYYKGGLLKKNFFSREFNRTFETVYLVSNIWKQPVAGSSISEGNTTNPHATVDLKVGDIKPASGTIKLSQLMSNKTDYNGKLVKVTGKVIKVNPMIMNRNWLHLQDSSGENFDLTITTTENIPLGAVVNLEGTIALDKDFGAGYRYDIIMEAAVIF